MSFLGHLPRLLSKLIISIGLVQENPVRSNSTGLIAKIFKKISEAQKPDRFTQDYLSDVLGYGSGSAKPVIPLMKRLGFLNSDGTPTTLYARFRNPSERSSAMLEALRAGYPTIYARSEYAHALPRDKLKDTVIEVTGLERDSSVVKAVVGTFDALKTIGGVEAATKSGTSSTTKADAGDAANTATREQPADQERKANGGRDDDGVGLNLSYTINLNLPTSADPEVFNAIFKALKEHLLGR